MNRNLIKKDYYQAVNEAWLEKATIPSDQPQMSAFLELHLDIEKTLMDLAKQWQDDQTGLDENLLKFVKLHKMTQDFEMREQLGIKPIEPILQQINALKTLKDLEAHAKALLLEDYDLPFGFSVMQDFMNSNNQILYFGEASLLLPDKSYYQDEKTKENLLNMFKQTTTQILNLYGYNQTEIEDLLNKTIAFDALLVEVAKTNVEKADYIKLYNPVLRKDIQSQITTFDLVKLADNLVSEKIDQLIVLNLDFFKAFNTIINEENFDLIKAWMLVSNLNGFASLLTEELRVASGAFRRILSGIQAPQSKEKAAFYHAYNRLAEAVGLHYGKNYFGPKAKADVKQMVEEIIAIYRKRIRDNTWLEDSTKEKAIQKLDRISVHVGYPDELPPYYQQYQVEGYEDGSNLVKETLKFSRLRNIDNFKKYNQEPNRNLWGMPASMVNAYYSPSNNKIVFPAAILQRPYYSLDQSPSENYGGIGAVMAHEISHAFDNNGAKFDEFGSLKNWWTDSDLKAFKAKSQDMIKLFDGVETGFGPCNGELTVSENIADSGGLRCALEASKRHQDHDYELFFANWAFLAFSVIFSYPASTVWASNKF